MKDGWDRSSAVWILPPHYGERGCTREGEEKGEGADLLGRENAKSREKTSALGDIVLNIGLGRTLHQPHENRWGEWKLTGNSTERGGVKNLI